MVGTYSTAPGGTGTFTGALRLQGSSFQLLSPSAVTFSHLAFDSQRLFAITSDGLIDDQGKVYASVAQAGFPSSMAVYKGWPVVVKDQTLYSLNRSPE